jgi:hypothetical protein
MTRMELAQSGRIKFNVAKKGDSRIPGGMPEMQQSPKSLFSKSPPLWMRDISIVGMTQAQIARELGRQVARLRSHDKLAEWNEQLAFVEVETIES